MSSIQVQSLPVQQSDLSLLPTIRIGNPPPECLPLPSPPKTTLGAPRAITGKHRGASSLVREGRIRRRESLRQQPRKPSALPSHMVKEVLQTKLSKEKKERDQKRKEASGKDQDSDMTHSQSRYSSVSSKSSSPEASPTSPPASRRGKSKSKSKDIDWSDVTDPEERRRIQNRIAQRKFREKTRDNKEKAEREARNQQYAGNSYRTPTADDFLNDMESDGLPWGSINFGHAILRGHESEGRRSSGRGTYIADESLSAQAPPTLTPVSAPAPYMMPYSQALPQAAPSFASSGTDDVYMEEANYTYAPVIQTFPPPPPHQ